MDEHYPVGDPMDDLLPQRADLFRKAIRRQGISRPCDNLRPGGHLILGHSESIHGLDLPLTTVANTVFRKKG
jgi:chemotaxis protein methyltransferase CheR